MGGFVVVYLDDILVYRKTEEEHLEHLKEVFETLRTQKLYWKIEKCSFLVDKVILLGFVVSKDGVAVDHSKVEVIKSWPVPTTITEV